MTYACRGPSPQYALLGHSKLNMVMRYAHPQEQHQADAMKRLETFNAAKEIRKSRSRMLVKKASLLKVSLQFPLHSPKIRPIFQWKKSKVSPIRSIKRRRSDSNRCIKVLQTTEANLIGAITQLNQL